MVGRRSGAVLVLSLVAALSVCPAVLGGSSAVCPAEAVTGEGWPVIDVSDVGIIGDGLSDNRNKLQSLIDSAGDGLVLTIPAGLYRLSGHLTMRSNLILQGSGPATVIRIEVVDHLLQYVGELDAPIHHTAVRDLRLEGLGVPSTNSLVYMGRYVRDAWVERCHLIDAGHDGWVALRDCSGICVRDNYVFGASDDGLNPGGSTDGVGTHDVLLEGNTVASCGQDGLHISSNSYDIVAIGNEVIGCSNGVGFYRSSDAVIENNVIRDCENGIITHLLSGPRIPAPRMIVRGNVVESCTIRGIDLVGEDLTVDGNHVTDVLVGMNIDGTNAVVEDNEVRNCGAYGIKIVGGDDAPGFRVVGNLVDGVETHDGIFIYADCGIVAQNMVRNTSHSSIRDQRRYSRIFGNDVDNRIVGVAGDTDCDRAIGLSDLLNVLATWGPCSGSVFDCPTDVDGDGVTGFLDLIGVLGSWGA